CMSTESSDEQATKTNSGEARGLRNVTFSSSCDNQRERRASGVVSRLGFEPRTPALKGQCSTVELPARLFITCGQLLRRLAGRSVGQDEREPGETSLYKITSLRPSS